MPLRWRFPDRPPWQRHKEKCAGKIIALALVIEGQDVADRIVNVKRNWSDKPKEPQVMKKVWVWRSHCL